MTNVGAIKQILAVDALSTSWRKTLSSRLNDKIQFFKPPQ
ncbi:hypothetical protein KHA80_22210 [Anaerobacillus sp. HL2]|nr:hypothetical protein KHA80_22210 [Anaerobacillus sp. HL2]